MNIFKKSVIMVNVREMAAHFFTENFRLDRRISHGCRNRMCGNGTSAGRYRKHECTASVSYTHLTLPTNREV